MALNIGVVDAITKEKSPEAEKHTVYKIVITKHGRSWFLFRRFTEFEILHKKLKRAFPQDPLNLTKKLFAFNKFSSDFIRERQGQLDIYLKELSSRPQLLDHEDARHFLNLDDPRNQSDANLTISEGTVNEDINVETSENAASYVALGPSERKKAQPNDFAYFKCVGKGSFGMVLVAKHKVDGKVYAVKVMNKEMILRKKEEKHILAERNVLKQALKHPFLVKLHYSFQTPDRLYFVLDLVNGGEMFYHLQKERVFNENRARFYSAELASALGYLHSNHIIYRDLKPENILLDREGHITLTDFGLCKENLQIGDKTSTFCGTPEYLAPEVLRRERYTMAVDWWCLGAVLYEMLYGLLLEKNPVMRFGALRDFAEIRSHAFFAEHINWDDLEARKIPPPFIPKLDGEEDLSNIDDDFKKASFGASIGKTPADPSATDPNFPNFTYKGTFSYTRPMEADNFDDF